MSECIFCKIIKGEIPCYKVYEDENTLAFLDISCDFYGHTLVVPKKHCQNLLDCDEKTLNYVMATVQKISKHYIDDCGFMGTNIFNSNNECSGQSVMHFHIHIIPRNLNDNIKLFEHKTNKKMDLSKIYKQIKL